MRGPGRVPSIVVLGAGLAVVHRLRQHMVDRPQQAMGDRHDGFLVAAMAHDSTLTGAEGAVLRVDRGEGAFDQRHAEPAVAFPRRSGLVLAGALVVARAEPRPAREMALPRKPAHVHADLGNHHLAGPRVDPRNRVQSPQGVGERDEQPLDLRTYGVDGLVEVVQMGEALVDEERVMRTKPPSQRLPQRRQFRAQLATRQLGQHLRRRGARDQRLQHGSPGHAQDVRRHRRELDPGVLQHLVKPVGFPLPLLDQSLAIAREVAQLANRRRGNEAAPQQPVLQQLRDPHAVLHVGLAPRHLFDMRGVHEQAPDGFLEHVIDRLPVHAPAFQRHVRHAVLLQPLPQAQELGRRRAEGLHVLLAMPAPPRDPHTCRHCVAMNVQPRTAFKLSLYPVPPPQQCDCSAEELLRSRFCSAGSNATMRGAESSHVRLTADSPVPRRIDVARAAAGAMLAHWPRGHED